MKPFVIIATASILVVGILYGFCQIRDAYVEIDLKPEVPWQYIIQDKN